MPADMGIYCDRQQQVFSVIQEGRQPPFSRRSSSPRAPSGRPARAARMAEIERKKEEAAERRAAGEIDKTNTSRRRLDAQSRNRECRAEALSARAAGDKAIRPRRAPPRCGTPPLCRGRAYETGPLRPGRHSGEPTPTPQTVLWPAADET